MLGCHRNIPALLVTILLAISSTSVHATKECALIIVDPQDEFISNRGIFYMSQADVLAEALAEAAVDALKRNCHVFVTAAFNLPQDCSFLSWGKLMRPEVYEWFFERQVQPVSLDRYDNSKEAKPALVNGPSTDQALQALLWHPTLLLRSPYIRQVYGNCELEKRCSIRKSPLEGKTLEDCEARQKVPYNPFDEDQDLECEDGQSRFPQRQFPPNRVMAPDGGAAISRIFLNALVEASIPVQLQKKLLFIARGFGAAQTSFASLMESRRGFPSKVDAGSNGISWPGDGTFTIQSATNKLEAPHDVRCGVTYESSISTDGQLQFDAIFGNSNGKKNVWRELARKSPPEDLSKPMKIDLNDPKNSMGVMKPLPELEVDPFLEGIGDMDQRLSRDNWKSYAMRRSYPHMCPSTVGPVPGQHFQICRERKVDEDFEVFLMSDNVDVEICGFGLEYTILETARDLKTAFSNRKVKVLGHLSVPLHIREASTNSVRIQKPPEEFKSILPPKIPTVMIAQYLSNKGVEFEHKGTFSIGPLRIGGWYDDIQNTEALKNSRKKIVANGINDEALVPELSPTDQDTGNVVNEDSGIVDDAKGAVKNVSDQVEGLGKKIIEKIQNVSERANEGIDEIQKVMSDNVMVAKTVNAVKSVVKTTNDVKARVNAVASEVGGAIDTRNAILQGKYPLAEPVVSLEPIALAMMVVLDCDVYFTFNPHVPNGKVEALTGLTTPRAWPNLKCERQTAKSSDPSITADHVTCAKLAETIGAETIQRQNLLESVAKYPVLFQKAKEFTDNPDCSSRSGHSSLGRNAFTTAIAAAVEKDHDQKVTGAYLDDLLNILAKIVAENYVHTWTVPTLSKGQSIERVWNVNELLKFDRFPKSRLLYGELLTSLQQVSSNAGSLDFDMESSISADISHNIHLVDELMRAFQEGSSHTLYLAETGLHDLYLSNIVAQYQNKQMDQRSRLLVTIAEFLKMLANYYEDSLKLLSAYIEAVKSHMSPEAVEQLTNVLPSAKTESTLMTLVFKMMDRINGRP